MKLKNSKLLWFNRNEVNLNYLKTDCSDLNTSEETVYFIEHINPVTIFFFFDLRRKHGFICGIIENSNSISAPPVSETITKVSDTGSTIQTISEKHTPSAESFLTSSLTDHRTSSLTDIDSSSYESGDHPSAFSYPGSN